MKQLIKLISILLVLSFVCMSCGKSTPKCTDQDVLKLSKELVSKVVTANVVRNVFFVVGLYDDAAMVTMNTYQDYINKCLEAYAKNEKGTYAYQFGEIFSSKDFNEFLNPNNYDFAGIRTMNVNEQQRAVECAAFVTTKNSNEKFNVFYKAYYTDDDKLYVEVEVKEFN